MWNLEDILADIENKEALEEADMIGDGSDSNTANNNKVACFHGGKTMLISGN